MSESLPYSIDIAKMRNAILPSVPSLLDCSGNEVQLEILKGSVQMDDLIGHFHGSNGFNMESGVYDNNNQLARGVYSLPSHSRSQIYDNNHQPGTLYGLSSSKDISQQSLSLGKKPLLTEYEGVSGNARKRSSEVFDNMVLMKKLRSNPNSTSTFLAPTSNQAKGASEVVPRHKLYAPMRRNQKLSDKVTTLQKLVSPFGKTDTASVLHEASLYIKLLQAQIRTLFQMLSLSYTSSVKAPHNQCQQECGDKLQVDLRSRGLCLVPISMTEKVTMEEQIHHAAASRRIILPRNF